MFTVHTIWAAGIGTVGPAPVPDLTPTTLARLAVLAGFVVATVVAVVLADRPRVRTAYVAGFFVCLLLFNLVGVAALPFMHWHKFSGDRPETEVLYEFRVVDAAGRELDYDHRATLAVDGFSMYLVTSRMDEYDEPRRAAVAAYLLARANTYRASIESRSALHLLRFPPHGVEDTWDELELAEYDEFVGVRYYRLELVTSADGTAVESYSEELLGEWTPDGPASTVRSDDVATEAVAARAPWPDDPASSTDHVPVVTAPARLVATPGVTR